MAGDNLTIILFFISLAAAFLVAAMSLMGWKNRAVITMLFILAAISLFFGLGWLWLKDIFPPLKSVIKDITSSPASWFSIIMLILGLFLFVTKGSFRLPPGSIPTHLKLRFIQGSVNPENIEQTNIRNWYALCHIYIAIEPSGAQHNVRTWSLFLTFEKPVAIKQFIFDAGGATLPMTEVKDRSDRHAIIFFSGDLGNNIIDVRAVV